MSEDSIYINSIDECVNNIIDSFYFKVIENKSVSKKFKSIDNIYKNFDELLSLIKSLINETVKSLKIKDLITGQDNYNKVIKLFNDYILLYFFFNLVLDQKIDVIISLLNKLNNKYKSDLFQHSYFAKFNYYYKYINDYNDLLNSYSKLKLDEKYKDIMISINNIGEDVILSIISDKRDISHNILKIIIFREIYNKEDKNLIYKILESEEFVNAEYKYIDIIDTIYDTVDYATVSSLFNIRDVKSGLAEEVYNMISEYEMRSTKSSTIDQKIDQLFQKKILIPITDEFLRYHKDTDVSEKQYTNITDRYNKKDNTKIKFIITKFNKIKNYYSQKVQTNPSLKIEIQKLFYQPLLNRKAIIINDIEEMNIISKLELAGKTAIESNEYYEDLKQLRLSAYVEFNSAIRDSFSFIPSKSLESIRYCNFETLNNPDNLKNGLQYRTINDSNKVNIVGVALARYNKYLGCTTLKNTKDLSSYYKNSFAVAINSLRKIFLEDRQYSKMLYWLFNRKNDVLKMNLFDNLNYLPTNDYMKLCLGRIYDEMVKITYYNILVDINSYESLTIDESQKIIKQMESKLVIIPRNSLEYAELMKLIYYLKVKTDINITDKNEEKILGIDQEVIRLPKIILEKIKLHIIKVSKSELLLTNTDETDMYEGYLCQHTVTWSHLMRYKRTDPNRFNQHLSDFIKKYVVENGDKDFVCKSCYQLVDLTHFTTEIYPGSDSIAISYSLDTELETIREYSKFTRSIKNLDKIIERLSYSSNLSYYVGSSLESKFRRQEVIKNIIDVIDIQYKTLYSKDTKERNDRSMASKKKYGCVLSNFFLFKFENEIFTVSSKETDKFKLFKMNNILTYILINFIIEINLSQILYLSFDKLVNYFLFTKFGYNLFDNLYIRISNKNDLAPLKNYKLLCYVIYYISGIYAKLNIWYSDVEYKANNINPQIQRIVIHTLVDALNSILEVNTKETKHYLYNIISTKFFNKLNLIYNDDKSKDVLDKLNKLVNKKVSITTDKKIKYSSGSSNAILLKPYNTDGKFILESSLGLKQKVASYPTIRFERSKLKVKSQSEILGDKQEKINEKFLKESLIKIGQLYDKNGNRLISKSQDTDEKVNDIKELSRIADIARENRLKREHKLLKKVNQKLEKIEIKNLTSEKYVKELKTKFNKDIDTIIREFIKKLESLIGKNININNNNYYLFSDVYEIDHDYKGNKRESIFLLENDKKVEFKADDGYFKQDIYYYYDATNRVTVYYSSIEKYLLGYKENSKDIIRVFNTDCYLRVRYSVLNQLKLLGFNYMNNKMNKDIKDFNSLKSVNSFANNILKIRLQNLKNCLSDIQQIIYQVKNHFDGSNLNIIAKIYISKIKKLETYDENSERIFKDWNILINSLYYENIEINKLKISSLPNTNHYVSSKILNEFNTSDKIILYYIIEQFNMLLDINQDNYTKNNVAYMIINIIIQLFRNLNTVESSYYNINVKKFYNYITNKAEVSSELVEDETANLNEEQLEKLKDEQDNYKESLDALDADQDEINEDFGDEEVLLYDRQSGNY